jgi:FkbM family methyltransferase
MKKNYSEKLIELPILYFFYKKLILYIWKYINPHPKQFLIYSSDIIGLGPQFFNGHEPHVVSAIKKFAESKYNHFFLDIGANIGLISCLVHEKFDLIEAVEPNPECFYVLKKNFEISLVRNYLINEFALDEIDGVDSLMIPRHNMGGAFKNCKNNSYTKQQIAAKDGFKFFSNDNYRVINIKTRSSSDYFNNFFKRMSKIDKKFGIIKIDVEGMELSIIDKIGDAIPNDFGVIIVFEHLSKTIDRKMLIDKFHGRKVSLYSIDKNYKNLRFLKKISYITKTFLTFRVKYSLCEINSDFIHSTDLVLKID